MNHNLKIPAFVVLLLLLTGCLPSSSAAGETLYAAVTAAVPTLAPAETNDAGQTHYEGERFSLEYPHKLTLYENERPSADGVTAPLENSIALQDERFLLTITAFDIAPGTSLTRFIEGYRECMEVDPSGGEVTKLGELEARLYPDTLCGLNGTTYLYAVQKATGYRLALEGSDAYAALQAGVQPILDSFKAVSRPSTLDAQAASARFVPETWGRFKNALPGVSL